MKDLEIQLMKVETRLDRIQNEVRKALGDVRKAMEYQNTRRQKTLYHYGVPRKGAGKLRGRGSLEKKVRAERIS